MTPQLPPIGRARIASSGTDVTLIAYSAMVQSALEAAQTLADVGHLRRSYRSAHAAAARYGEHCGLGARRPIAH